MEKAYFPMGVLNISQGYGSNSYSHQSIMALDLAGKDTKIDDVFAPFTGIIKKIYTKDANEVWLESKEPVIRADGKITYLTAMFAHDNTVSDLKVGQIIKQGHIFYQEGKKSSGSKVTGNHNHFEIGEGKFTGSGWFQNKHGQWQINNPLAPEKVLCLRKGTVVKKTVYEGKDYMMKWEDEVKVPEQSKPTYTPGTYKTLFLKYVRTGPGTEHAKKKVKDLTVNGKANATSSNLNADAQYRVGTEFDVLSIHTSSKGSIWAKSRSGFVCIWDSSGPQATKIK